MSQFFKKGIEFNLFGHNITIRWTIFLVTFNLIAYAFKWYYIFIALLCHIFLILIHELGHAFFCKLRNYEVENIVVDYWGGYCLTEAPEYRNDEILISSGGVIFQFILLLVSSVILIIFYPILIYFETLYFILLYQLIIHNSIVLLFNLIPVPDLDGYRIFSAIDFSNIKYWINEKKHSRIKKKKMKEKEVLKNKIINIARKSYKGRN